MTATSGGRPAAVVRMTAFEGRAMGSPLRLTLVTTAPDPDGAWDALRDVFELAEEAMSRFRDTSELTRLNRSAGSGRMVVPSARLRIALAAAERARRVTNGRFDARVLGALDRLGYRGASLVPAAAAGEVDGGERAAGTAGAGGMPSVRRSGRRRVAIDAPLDLGGIGKGLTLRWAAARLDRLGWTDFLLEAGGDLVARGRPTDAAAWTVGVEDPAGTVEPLAAIAVPPPGGAVATSSVRVHRWAVGGRAVHHLLDPSTGEPGGGGLLSATVAGPDPAWAEVWSKSLFLAGANAIAAEARARGLAAWWVDEAGVVGMTPAARQRSAWVAGEDGSAERLGPAVRS